MGKATGIEWTDHTFNPWWGCVKVSPACDHCYAATLSKRYGHDIWGKDAPRRFFGDKHWDEPRKWNKQAEAEGVRRRVFCGSMCDVMEDRADLQPQRERLYELIEATSYLDWQLLTKRPQNFRRFLPKSWLTNPLQNVWGMTTVESDMYQWRIKALLDTPFTVRGLSCEPLVGPVNLQPFLRPGSTCSINWVIAGGESGPGARPVHPDWIRSLRDQCEDADVAFFFKQWGDWLPVATPRLDVPIGKTQLIHIDGSAKPATWGDVMNATGDLWAIQKVLKKKAGASLDGIEHKEFPSVVHRVAEREVSGLEREA